MNNRIVIKSADGNRQLYWSAVNREFVTDEKELERKGVDLEQTTYVLVNEATGEERTFRFKETRPSWSNEFMDGEPYDGRIYEAVDDDLEGVTMFVTDRYWV